jgi:hypothetical protein
MIGNWRAFLYDKNNNFVAELPFEGLSIVFELNAVYKASIRVNYHIFKSWMSQQNVTIEQVLTSGFRWVKIVRDSSTIFKGILSEASVQKFDMDINVSLTFKGWLGYFERRYITKTYTNTDQGLIAWDIINTAQSESYGNIGITQGTIETTVNRDRTYKDEEITKSLIHLSNSEILNGYEFEITNDKVFTAKARLGADKPYIVFDRSNIKSWQVDYKLALLLTNQIKAYGSGLGDTQLTVTRNASDAYKDKWYLLQDHLSSLSVSEQATLEAEADRKLDLNKDFSKTFQLTVVTNNIELTEYNIGDKVKVEIENIINNLYRIKTKEININNGEEEVRLEFLFS